jgi:small multidrug resistance family-3 protein
MKRKLITRHQAQSSILCIAISKKTFNQKTDSITMMLKTIALFVLTALAEIIGCFLPYLWLRKSGSIALLIPAAASLALFVWLLTLHPAASGRVYAAYGCVYVATALVWLRVVDGVKLSAMDWAGASIALLGMFIIVAGWNAKS